MKPRNCHKTNSIVVTHRYLSLISSVPIKIWVNIEELWDSDCFIPFCALFESLIQPLSIAIYNIPLSWTIWREKLVEGVPVTVPSENSRPVDPFVFFLQKSLRTVRECGSSIWHLSLVQLLMCISHLSISVLLGNFFMTSPIHAHHTSTYKIHPDFNDPSSTTIQLLLQSVLHATLVSTSVQFFKALRMNSLFHRLPNSVGQLIWWILLASYLHQSFHYWG